MKTICLAATSLVALVSATSVAAQEPRPSPVPGSEPPHHAEPFVYAPFNEPPHHAEPFVYAELFHQQPPGSRAPVVIQEGPFQLRGRMSAERIYQQARDAIEQNRYDRALPLLDQVILMKEAQADAAMYWKAYSQARIARRTDALTTLADLQKQFAKSRWINDARALEVEIRQASGQAVAADGQVDEELRLLALRSVMQNDAESALPLIEKILGGTSSPRVKDQALFVLSRSKSPKARAIVLGVARGNGNPEVQLKAIRYLGMMGGAENREALDDVYRNTTDEVTKRAILRSYTAAGAREQLLALAKSEPSIDLRREAVLQLGALRATTELEALYRGESTPEVKRAVIDALGNRNAKVLVSLARAEKDPDLKKTIVARLSMMQAPEAREYMLELLK